MKGTTKHHSGIAYPRQFVVKNVFNGFHKMNEFSGGLMDSSQGWNSYQKKVSLLLEKCEVLKLNCIEDLK